jgi:hypothetical protein
MLLSIALRECFALIPVRISGARVLIVTMTSKKLGDNETSDSALKRVSLQNTRSTKGRPGRLICGTASAPTCWVLNPVNAAMFSPTNKRHVGYRFFDEVLSSELVCLVLPTSPCGLHPWQPEEELVVERM